MEWGEIAELPGEAVDALVSADGLPFNKVRDELRGEEIGQNEVRTITGQYYRSP